jgi:hypothetical protein
MFFFLVFSNFFSMLLQTQKKKKKTQNPKKKHHFYIFLYIFTYEKQAFSDQNPSANPFFAISAPCETIPTPRGPLVGGFGGVLLYSGFSGDFTICGFYYVWRVLL